MTIIGYQFKQLILYQRRVPRTVNSRLVLMKHAINDVIDFREEKTLVFLDIQFFQQFWYSESVLSLNNDYPWYQITRAFGIYTQVPLLSSFCSQYIYWAFADNNRFCGTNYGDLVCSCPFTCTYDTHSRAFWCYGYQWLLRSNYLWTLKCA